MQAANHYDIVIEPAGEGNTDEIAELYYRRCDSLRFSSLEIVAEYLRRNLKSRNHLHAYLIRKNATAVGASHMVKVGRNTGLVLFTAADESFTGPEMMIAFGKAYRETLRRLVANGISRVLSVAPKNNAPANAYSLATGYIKYFETDTMVCYETFLPLLASLLATLSGVSLNDISLLKLARIASNPVSTDGSSYTFEFDFNRVRYVLKTDKLSAGIESVSCPGFSVGIECANHSATGDEESKVSLNLFNPTNHPKEFKLAIGISEDGYPRPFDNEQGWIQPCSRLNYPIEFGLSRDQVKDVYADVEVDERKFQLRKSFAPKEALRVSPNLSGITPNQTVLNICNATEKRMEILVRSTQAEEEIFEKTLSVEGKGIEPVEIPVPRDSSNVSVRMRLGQRGTTKNVSVSSRKNGIFLVSDEDYICSNKLLAFRINRATGILSIGETHDPCCVVFQLPEELGPPFTEYEFNTFQSMPMSYETDPCSSGLFPSLVTGIELVARDMDNGPRVTIRYSFANSPGLSLEKTVLFRERNKIEICPKLVNSSHAGLRTALIIRTCIRFGADATLKVPMGKDSTTTSKPTVNPYYVDEMILKGDQLRERWAAFEFPDSRKCVELAWQGNPKCDFLPLWFNKMPWLVYDISLASGNELILPSHAVAFKGGSWKSAWDTCS